MPMIGQRWNGHTDLSSLRGPVHSNDVLRSAPRQFTLPPPEGDEPVLIWGGPSDFGEFNGWGFEVTKNQVWVETNRETEDVKIQNPEDEQQYVMVKRVKSITLRNSDGETRKETYNTTGNSML